MGTALEVARVIVMSPEVQLATPLMLLLNGGEETILTAAHGFMNTSKWAPRVGAFINLESTGPGGPDVLFQHTGQAPLYQESPIVSDYLQGSCPNHSSDTLMKTVILMW